MTAETIHEAEVEETGQAEEHAEEGEEESEEGE